MWEADVRGVNRVDAKQTNHHKFILSPLYIEKKMLQNKGDAKKAEMEV